jgi:hypothetical protein
MKTKKEVIFDFSQYLRERAKEDFSNQIFAFANYQCGYGEEGLGIFLSGEQKILMNLSKKRIETENWEELYQKLKRVVLSLAELKK